MRVMIAQPMNGKSDIEIQAARATAVDVLRKKGYEIVDSYFADNYKSNINGEDVRNIALSLLAASLQCMSICNAVYFCKGWENARGCRIEHEAAKAYGLEIIYE